MAKYLLLKHYRGAPAAVNNVPMDQWTPDEVDAHIKFMNDFGLITARDPKGVYHSMTDVIHKVLNDITVDEWAIIIGGDSHTRMSKGVAFGADSGTVALALATGEASMPIPESVKVTFKGQMKDHMDFRDVVHATQAQMLQKFGGENVFQGGFNALKAHFAAQS